MASLSGLVDHERVNAWLSWGLVAFLLVATVESLATGSPVWGILAAAVAVIAVVPAVVFRDHRLMVHWEVLAVAVVPVVARSYGLFTQIATYSAVAAAALMVVAEIDQFSSAEMTPGFAVLFVVMTTMTAAGVWAIVQWLSDAALGTDFLTGPTALMWDLVVATGVGVVAGLAFELYVRRYAAAGDRFGPTEGDV